MLKPITQETANRFAGLIIGQSGIGKTSLLRTIMGQTFDVARNGWIQEENPIGRVCVLSAESGLLCVRDLVQAGYVEGFEIGSLSDFREALQVLSHPDSQAKYQWIFIDSLTEIASRCVEAMKAKYPDKKDSFPMWGEYTDTMTAMIKAFRDMTAYNIVFLSLDSVEKDELNRRFVGPDIAGNGLKQRLPSYFDEVIYLALFRDEQGRPYRAFVCHPTEKFPAKDRSGRLEPIEKPCLRNIFKKIISGGN